MMTPSQKDVLPPRREILPGIWLDARLALWLADLGILVVADLHWGYAASHRAQGNLLPAWGDATIAQRLTALIHDYQPKEMIWLGDSLHSVAGQDAALEFLRMTATAVTIVSGNHDARWSRAKDHQSLHRSHYFLHHGDKIRPIPHDCLEIVGHHHPAVSWQDGAGTRLKVPALVASSRRLVLPAFSPWAGGVPWKRGNHEETIHAITSKRIFTVPHASAHKEP